MNPLVMEEAVERGVMFLDDAYGSDEWQDLVDLDLLDLTTCASCTLGQLFRALSSYDGFGKALGFLGLERETAIYYGFMLDSGWSFEEYDQLTALWREALR